MDKLLQPGLESVLINYGEQLRLLRAGAFQKGNDICLKLQELALKHFPQSSWYVKELPELRFKPLRRARATQLKRWKETIEKLLAILEAMIEEIRGKIMNQHKQLTCSLQRHRIMVVACFIAFSLLLWLFNEVLCWKWLSEHPRRISIYCCFQLTLIVGALLLGTEKKRTDVFIIFLTILLAMCAMF
jgi:hypothetical protein